MATQAEPQLLSLLEKASNPISKLNIAINLKGVFAPPEQWKTTDQANPGIFTYTVQLFGKRFEKGKIEPRKLTQKELKQQEETKAKKGAKKQTKQQEKPAQVDPQEEKRKKQWEALSEQQKFYRTSEDPYKAFSLKFPEQKLEMELEGQSLIQFQRCVDDGQMEITLLRRPQLSEDQLAKLKKSKPKNLNLGQLYQAVYKGKIDMSDFSVPGSNQLTKRVKMELGVQPPAQNTRIEAGECYTLIGFQLDQPITPKVTQIKPEVKQLQPQFEKKSVKKDTRSVAKLKLEIIRAVKAISQEYTFCFSKQKEHQDDRRHSNMNNVSTLRVNEINKKKEQFLNQLTNNGKYALLRDRIAQTIKAMCLDKFRKERQKGPIDKSKIHQTLSELNVYFRQEFVKTVDEFLANQSHLIHQDLVLGHQISRQTRKQIIAPIMNESKQEKELRIATEYETINSIDKAQENYLNLLLMNKEDLASLEAYAKFCLKNKKFETAYAIYEKISNNSPELNHKLVLAILLVRRQRQAQVSKLVTEMMQSDSASIADKILYNQLLSFAAEREGDIKLSEKYLALAQKYYQIKLNPNAKLNPVKNPYEDLAPKVPKPARYTSQLTNDQSQEIRSNFIGVLADCGVYDLVQEYLPKLNDSHRKEILKVQAKVFMEQYEQALQIMERLIKQNQNSIDLLLMKADICYRADKMFQSEQIFLYILKLKPNPNQIFSIFLRLGFTYLNRKSWDDAKGVFQKACQMRCNSALSWMGLGIANLNLGDIGQAEEALDLSNIYNPLDGEIEKYLQKVRSIQKDQYEKRYKYLKDPIPSK